MRKLVLLFAILLQGCYSYKSVDINPKTMVLGQVYKIERNNKTSKVTYTSNADSAIVVMKNGVEESIPLKDIIKARQQKFSVINTFLWYPISVVGLAVLFLYGS
jgi:uncharacterized protein YcfL